MFRQDKFIQVSFGLKVSALIHSVDLDCLEQSRVMAINLRNRLLRAETQDRWVLAVFREFSKLSVRLVLATSVVPS